MSFSILVNSVSILFRSSRRPKQGDPISRIFSCLFVKRFPTYALSTCSIIDILFTNDTLLFTRAIRQEVDNLLHILQSYAMASDQSINLHKSHILFSKHTF